MVGGGGYSGLVRRVTLPVAKIMAKIVVVLFFLGVCWGQEIAKRKCEEYAALAKAHSDSPQCKALTDKKTGVKIEPNEFPATAMLGYESSTGEVKYLCDATLISEDTLLAAGHCLQQKVYGRPKWTRLGATATTLGIEVEVKESLCHPKYAPGHDIAIIKLKEKVNSSFVPACLDTEGVAEGTHGTGVGRPIGSAYVELRKTCPVKAELEVRPGADCKETFPQQNISTEATLCTKDPANGPGDCLSGPLYVSKHSCVHTVAGIASFGKSCKSESADGRTPSVYTRVSHFISWIEERTWPNSTTPTA